MTAPAAPALYAARPRLFLDGQENIALAQSVLEMSVDEDEAGLCHCELTLANWGPKSGTTGYLHFDRQTLDFGKVLRIEAGGGDKAGQIFEGKITALEGRYMRERPPELLVLAEDKLQELRMTRRTRTFEQKDDATLIQDVASPHGLSASVNVSGPTHTVVAQVNQSDLAFLRERARAVDAEVWVEGTTLHAEHRASRTAGNVALSFGAGLMECSMSADLAGQVSGFAVTGWDVAGKQGISHRATDSVLGAELDGKLSGSGILGTALGTRDQQMVHLAPVTAQEAQALAEAQYRRTARRFVTGTALAEADARLRVGTHVDLSGLGVLFDGKYYVTRVTHLFDMRLGLRTQFVVERPGLGQ